MRPEIAISLSQDGISFLHRTSDGWTDIGSVPLDHPKFDNRVRKLRSAAEALVGGALRSKLIIPNSEILYTHVTAPGPDEPARHQQIRDAIVGLTPYEVDELVFDWRPKGDMVELAIVARETLDEAEAFATAHNLGAVCFVASPSEDRFGREVFLGQTAAGARENTSGLAPRPEASGAAAGGTAPRDAKASEPESAPRTPPPAVPAATAAAKRPPAPPTGSKPKVALDAASASMVAASGASAAGMAAGAAVSAASTAGIAAASSSGASVAFASRRTQNTAAPSASPAPPPALAPGAPPSLKAGTGGGALMQRLQGLKARLRGAAPDGDGESSMGSKPSQKLGARARDILKRRGNGGAGQADAIHGQDNLTPKPAVKPATKPAVTAWASDETPKSPPQVSSGSSASRDLKQALAAPVQSVSPKSGQKPNTVDSGTSEADKLTIFGARGRVVGEQGFGRRGLMLTGGLLLILAAVGLWAVFFMSGPSTPTGQATLGEPQAQIAPEPLVSAPPVVSEPEADVAADAAAGAAVDAQIEPAPEALASEGMGTELLEDLAQLTPFDEQAEIDATLDAVDTGLGGLLEGGAPLAEAVPQPGSGDSADLRADTSQDAGDPMIVSALTPPSADTSELPQALPSPAPFGTEQMPGVATAGAGGEPLPEVFEGRPPSAPPVRPAGLAPQQDAALDAVPVAPAQATADTARIATEEAIADSIEEIAQQSSVPAIERSADPDALVLAAFGDGAATFTGDESAFAALRPAPRPGAASSPSAADATTEDATPATGTDSAADAQPDADADIDSSATELPAASAEEDALAEEDVAQAALPATGTAEIDIRATNAGGLELTALRPATRPGALSALETPRSDATSATPEFEGGEPMAVAVSLQPKLRPADFDERVREIRAAILAAAPPVPTAEASPLPSATPSIPSSASVAQAATQPRAINTREINLLGVSGSTGNRTALVRLANGNVERVRVGDRLDRGQVTAIGEDALVYVRGSRTFRLQIGRS